jgi:predicted MFS family arabinose efflux permease
MGLSVALGFGRFAYAMLLPPMRLDLGWGYTEAGLMNTANALGYLVGAIAAPYIIKRLGVWRAFLPMMVTTALSLGFISVINSFWLMLLVRIITGILSAVIFVAAGTLVSLLAIEQPNKTGLILGINIAGIGFGISLSGILLQGLATFELHWRNGWLGLGVLAVAASALGNTSWRPQPTSIAQTQTNKSVNLAPLISALAAYFLFGLGYVSYMTFIIAFLQSNGIAAGVASAIFVLLGLCIMLSSLVWQRVIERATGSYAIAATMFATCVATLLPLLSVALPIVTLSAGVFGLSFLSVVSAVTAYVRRNLPKEQWTRGLALFTTTFATGQILGPTLTGFLSDRLGGLAIGLAFSAFALAIGAIIASAQHKH